LEKLGCQGCTRLTEIPIIPGLKEVYCNECTSLTRIPDISGLEKLWCEWCTRLTEIPDIPGLKELCNDGCTWIEQNPDFQYNLSCLIKLQRWVRKYRPLRILKRWMATEEFAMWYYHPENPGGLRQKMKMRKLFGEIGKSLTL
jgi:hypothetical protein